MGWSVFRRGVTVTFRHVGDAVRASVLPLVVGIAGHVGILWLLSPARSETTPDEVILLSTSEGMILLAALLVWWLAILSTVALGWFRSLDGTRIGWVPTAPVLPIFKILNRMTLLTLIGLIILVVVGYPIRALTAPMVIGGAPWVALVVFVFLLVLMIYAFLRLGLGVPAAARGIQLGLIGSASKTRKRSDPLLITAACVSCVWFLSPALGLLLPFLGPFGLVLQLLVLWIGFLILLAILHLLLSEAD